MSRVPSHIVSKYLSQLHLVRTNAVQSIGSSGISKRMSAPAAAAVATQVAQTTPQPPARRKQQDYAKFIEFTVASSSSPGVSASPFISPTRSREKKDFTSVVIEEFDDHIERDSNQRPTFFIDGFALKAAGFTIFAYDFSHAEWNLLLIRKDDKPKKSSAATPERNQKQNAKDDAKSDDNPPSSSASSTPIRSFTYEDCGGKTDMYDYDIETTAAREVWEESNGCWSFIDLLHLAYLSDFHVNDTARYVHFFVPSDYYPMDETKSLQVFGDTELHESGRRQVFEWVPMSQIDRIPRHMRLNKGWLTALKKYLANIPVAQQLPKPSNNDSQ